jgi:hypothetical protein
VLYGTVRYRVPSGAVFFACVLLLYRTFHTVLGPFPGLCVVRHSYVVEALREVRCAPL